MPEDNSQNVGTELATLPDGMTYVSIPDDIVLPKQPEKIANSVKVVILTEKQMKEIKQYSPHIRLINKRVREKIKEKYTHSDETKYIRLATMSLYGKYPLRDKDKIYITEYEKYVNNARKWGRAEKAKLGLGVNNV